MLALGLDAATHTGWALVDRTGRRERLISRGVVDLSGEQGRPSEVVSGLVQWIRRFTTLEGLPVAIELPYLAHGKAQNVAVLRTLAMLCGRWQQAFGVYGADIEMVRASDWQRRILGKFGGQKRAERKKAAKLWATGTFGVRLTEDEADAVAIATDLLRERDAEAMLERAAAI